MRHSDCNNVLCCESDFVTLNRGNHEDFAVCVLYGFQTECCEKYDEETFGMFSELFQHLPLFAVINSAVFVVHGGLFHDKDVTLEQLNMIRRSDFVLREETLLDASPPTAGSDSNSNTSELRSLQREALWTDPRKEDGYGPSSRGVGFHFGPDVTRRFLEVNNLKMVVRSHESVFGGFEQPYAGDDKDILVTIFSASNYGGGRSAAAYLKFFTSPQPDSRPVPGTDMCYTVRHFTIKPTLVNAESMTEKPQIPLHEMIISKHDELRDAFVAADVEHTGKVSRLKWADIMQKVTQLKIRWLTMVPFIIPEFRRSDGAIDYAGFLEDYLSLKDA